MPNILALAMKLLVFKANAFETATKDPLKAQKKVLFEYLSRNKDTEYGRKHDFASIGSIDEFKKRLPLVNYEIIKPYVDRMAAGENNILTKDKVIFFGITSGSTGNPKLIPVTKYSRAKKAETMFLWTYYICRDHPRILDNKVLAIISPEMKSHTEAGIPYGPEDGHAYNNLPAAIKYLYVLPYELFYVNDYDARYYCMLRIAMERRISTIATLNPSTIVLLCQRIDDLKERIIEDIEKGTLSREFNIPGNVREIIEKNLRPNPERSDELKEILKKKGKLLPKDFWPELELIECWKGGTVKLYLKELPPYLGDIPIRDFGCLSTEARNSIPMTDEGAGSVLAVNANFYEFIPREDIDKEDKQLLLCDQLKTGKEYALVVTTPGGLYRYNIDDIVIVKGFYNKTPIIEFVQKGHNVVSLTGEKLYESHVSEAINKVAESSGVRIKFFSATVQMDKPPRYVFLVEFEDDLSGDKKTELLTSIEKELFRQNSEYEDIRRQQLLSPPILKVVKKGDFELYRAKKVREGAHDTQFKIPKLSRAPDFQSNFNVEEEICVDDSRFFR